MAAESSIEWTEATWNPTRGCTRCSPGCVNCYAERIAARFSGKGLAYEGLAKMTKAGARWTGKLRLVEDALDAPLRWSRPRRIFVNSMSDLFHESLALEQIAEVFAVMYLAPRHTFQVLTKRAARMREITTSPAFFEQVRRDVELLRARFPRIRVGHNWALRSLPPWIWLGVSVESPEYLHRLTELMRCPSATHFASCEPLLADLGDISHWLTRGLEPRSLDWVIVGGESGPGARPFDVAWARAIVRQCAAAGVACFVKQLGKVPFDSEQGITPDRWHTSSSKGNDPALWPEELRVRQFPEVRRG